MSFTRLQRLGTDELIEMDELSDVHLLVDLVPDLQSVADDPVLIYFALGVLMVEQTEAQLIVVWDEVVPALACDSEVDVGYFLIMVHKEDVLVEEHDVQQDDHELNQEGQEVADEAGTSSLLVEVVEQLEKISSFILICEINDGDQGEIENGEEAEPGEGFA